MTGTSRRWWLVGGGAVVVAVVALATVLVLRGDDEDSGTDTTPAAQLAPVATLADLVAAPDGWETAAAAIGDSLGTVTAALSTEQDFDTFHAAYGRGPRDVASQLGSTLADLAYTMSPPSACGNRAEQLAVDDTAFVLWIASTAVTELRPDVDRADAIASILPEGVDDRPAELAEQIALTEVTPAAEAVVDELGDAAARLVVAELMIEIREVLNASAGADYLTDFTAGANFVGNVTAIADDCD
jgi:hypothetical protein